MNADPKVVYEFGPIRMDPDKQVLLRDGQLIAVTPKAFETLHFTTGAQNHTKPEDNIFAQPPLRQTSHPLSHPGARFMRGLIAHKWPRRV
jgi:hypothetical protein